MGLRGGGASDGRVLLAFVGLKWLKICGGEGGESIFVGFCRYGDPVLRSSRY